MIVIDVIVKTMREITRNRGNMLILLLTPVIFFSFFGFIFQPSEGGQSFRDIGIINHDLGYSDNPVEILPDDLQEFNHLTNMGELYIEIMQEDQKLLIESEIGIILHLYQDSSTMIRDIETQNIELGIEISAQFSDALVKGYKNLTGQSSEIQTATISIYADQSQADYLTNFGLVEESLSSFESLLYGADRLYNDPINGGYLEITTQYRQINDTSDFQYMVSGFLVFNALLQMITASTYITKEKEQKTINRLKLSNIQTWELLVGITISQIGIFILQFILSIGVLTYWGILLSVIQWLRIFWILILVTIILTGISLMVASVVKTSDDASTITGIGSAPLGFLSGSFLPVPELYIINSIKLQFWDLIPTYHATQAISEIIIQDLTYLNILPHLIAMIIYTIIIYMLGIIIFNRTVINGSLS